MRPSTAEDEDAGDLGQIRLAAESDLADGSMMAVKPPGLERIAIYRLAGRLYATQDSCTHSNASLAQGYLEDHRVICAAHGGEFCIRTGAALCFPATEPLRCFRVWVRDAVIYGDLTGAVRQADGAESPV